MRALPLALLLLAGPAWAADKIDVARGVEQAKVLTKAVQDGDSAKASDGSLPALVELLGGREKMTEKTNEVLQALKNRGTTIKSYTVGKPGDPVADGKTAYLVVPTTMELAAKGEKVAAESYLLGVTTDGGKTWGFVDAVWMEQPAVREKLFPKLPTGLKLPERKPPVVTKD